MSDTGSGPSARRDEENLGAPTAVPSGLLTRLTEPRRLMRVLWAAVVLWILLSLAGGPLGDALLLGGDADLVTKLREFVVAVLGLVVTGVALTLVGRLVSRWIEVESATTVSGRPSPEAEEGDSLPEKTKEDDEKEDPGVGFPHPTTVGVGAWLVVMSLFFLVAIVQLLSPSDFVAAQFPGIVCQSDDQCQQVHFLAVTIVSAGIGSMITTIFGYMEHAAEKANFKLQFVPWYFARPLIGLLLGAVFFFLLKGGLLAIGSDSSAELNKFGLAGVGALVGMFSKNAVEKLREVFDVLFHPKPDNPKPDNPTPDNPTTPEPGDAG